MSDGGVSRVPLTPLAVLRYRNPKSPAVGWLMHWETGAKLLQFPDPSQLPRKP